MWQSDGRSKREPDVDHVTLPFLRRLLRAVIFLLRNLCATALRGRCRVGGTVRRRKVRRNPHRSKEANVRATARALRNARATDRLDLSIDAPQLRARPSGDHHAAARDVYPSRVDCRYRGEASSRRRWPDSRTAPTCPHSLGVWRSTASEYRGYRRRNRRRAGILPAKLVRNGPGHTLRQWHSHRRLRREDTCPVYRTSPVRINPSSRTEASNSGSPACPTIHPQDADASAALRRYRPRRRSRPRGPLGGRARWVPPVLVALR